MVGVKKKLERRERTRERKALAAAHIEKTIEKELLDRLRSKAYGDAPLNVNEDVWRQVLEMDRKGKEKELDMDEMMDDESDLDEEEEEYEGGEREYVEADDSDDDMEDFDVSSSLLSVCAKLMISPTKMKRILERNSHQISKSPMRKMRMKTTMRRMAMQETLLQRVMVKAKHPPLHPHPQPDQRGKHLHPRRALLLEDVSFLRPSPSLIKLTIQDQESMSSMSKRLNLSREKCSRIGSLSMDHLVKSLLSSILLIWFAS
jgi:hypothetical protein